MTEGHQVLEFKPASVSEGSSKTHNPRWPKTGPIFSLQTLLRATWNLFQDLPASSVPCSILQILLLSYWEIHWQVLLQNLWPPEIQIMSSDYCNSDKCPLSCSNHYILKSFFWWNGHSLAWTVSRSESNSRRRPKSPGKKDSSKFSEIISVMQYPN